MRVRILQLLVLAPILPGGASAGLDVNTVEQEIRACSRIYLVSGTIFTDGNYIFVTILI